MTRTTTTMMITMRQRSLQSQSRGQPTKRNRPPAPSLARPALTRWMSALATDDPFHPRNARSSTPPGRPAAAAATCSTGVEDSAQMESYTEKKWSTISKSTCFNTICAFDAIILCTSELLLYLSQFCVSMFGRSIGGPPAPASAPARPLARPLLLLWRLSLWNNPSASECSLDSRGGEGRTERRTQRGPGGGKSGRASEASFESTPIIPGIIYHLVG